MTKHSLNTSNRPPHPSLLALTLMLLLTLLPPAVPASADELPAPLPAIGGGRVAVAAARLFPPPDIPRPDYAPPIALDGTTAAVADTNSTSIHLYDRAAAAPIRWQHTVTIATGVGRALHMLLRGDTLIAFIDTQGSGALKPRPLQIFERNHGGPGHWGLAASLAIPNQWSLPYGVPSLDFDGQTLVVGTVDDELLGYRAGAVHLFARDAAGTWASTASLRPRDGDDNGFFGMLVAVSAGRVAVYAGASYDVAGRRGGAVHVFAPGPGGDWVEEAEVTIPETTVATSLAFHHGRLLVGLPYAEVEGRTNQGRVRTLTRTEDGWRLAGAILSPEAAAEANFGMALAADGEALVVSAPGARVGTSSTTRGKLYLFSDAGTDERHLLDVLSVPGTSGLGTPRRLVLSGGTIAGTISVPQGSTSYATTQIFEFHLPPTVRDDSVTTSEDLPVLVDVLANDTLASDGGINPQSMAIVSAPGRGAAVVADGQIRYTPAPNTSGVDAFTYRVAGVSGATATATAHITVAPLDDDPPVITSALSGGRAAKATATRPFALALWASDPDNDPALAFQLEEVPAWLSLVAEESQRASLRGTPAESDIGPQTALVVVVDSTGRRAELRVAVEVVPLIPPAPGSLQLQNAQGSIVLTWEDRSTAESGFWVERQTASGWTQIASRPANSTTFTDNRQVCPGSYTYRVIATGPYGSAAGEPATIALASCPIPPPAQFTASVVGGSQVALAWSGEGTGQAHSFKIERDDGGGWQQIAHLNSWARGYTDSNLACAVTYQYRLRAESELSIGASSATSARIEDCTIAAPADLSAMPGDGDTIVLGWRDLSDNELGFIVERSLDGGASWSELPRVGSNAQTYIDYALDCRVTASYRVRAYHRSAESTPSATASATSADRCAPAAPGSVELLSVGRRLVEIGWADPGGATTFLIQRSPLAEEHWRPIRSVAAGVRSYVDATLACSAGYRYRVIAQNASGESPPSPVIAATTAACQGPIYVDAAAQGARSGLTWADAYPDLQLALADAAAGDQIWVAAGAYRPTSTLDRNRAFMLVGGVALYGGFAGGEASLSERDWRRNPTILSGNIGDQASAGDNSYNVVRGDAHSVNALIDGFTIRDGYANGPYGTNSQYQGGGMYSSGGTPRLRNIIFTANRARRGGGLTAETSNPVLERVFFVGNVAEDGGGMAAIFQSNPTLDHVVFSGNRGAGIYNYWQSSPTLTHVTFGENFGLSMENAANSRPLIRNSLISGSISNNTSNSLATLVDSHIAFGNAPPFTPGFAGERVSVGPVRFVDADGADNLLGTPDDDLRPASNSGGIDHGNSAWLYPGVTTDMAGAPRRADHYEIADSGPGGAPMVDAGAYEYQPPISPAAAPAELSASPRSRVSITLRWADQSPDEDGFVLERQGAGGAWERLVRLPAGETSYIDAGLRCGEGYTYRMRAVNSGGSSAPSAIASAAAEDCGPRLIYVDGQATGAATGQSWADAYPDLRQALGPDTLPGDEIWIAAGTYRPSHTGDQSASFRLIDNVSLYGGFRGDETSRDQRDPAANRTILDGDLAGDDPDAAPLYEPAHDSPLMNNSYRVVTGVGIGPATMIDGLTISGGNGFDDALDRRRGGGMYLEASSPTLRNVLFRRNVGDLGGGLFAFADSNLTLERVEFRENLGRDGGGLYLKSSDPTIIDSRFVANHTGYGTGGGFYALMSRPHIERVELNDNDAYHEGGGAMIVGGAPVFRDVRLMNNSALCGGGIYSERAQPVLVGTVFEGNSTSYCGGGGMYALESDATLREVRFIANKADGFDGGGGMMIRASAPLLRDVIFLGNSAPSGGGLLNDRGSRPVLVNVSLSGNVATRTQYNGDGGGAVLNSGASPTLLNVTMTHNSANLGGGMRSIGASAPRVVNSIIWANSATVDGANLASVAQGSVSFSIVQGGFPGPGNRADDPLLADPDGADNLAGTADDDLRLRPGSPAIDAGDSDVLDPEVATDLAGAPRRADDPAVPDSGSGPPPVVDIGAYEASGIVPPPSTTASPTGTATSSATPATTATSAATPSVTATATLTHTVSPGATGTATSSASPTVVVTATTTHTVSPGATAPPASSPTPTPTDVIPSSTPAVDPSATAAPPEPEATISDSYGQPGSVFRVSGRGFAPGASLLVSVGSAQAGTVRCDERGTFVLDLHTSPEAAPGVYELRLDRESGPALGTALHYRLAAEAPLRSQSPSDGAQELWVPLSSAPTGYALYLPTLTQ